MSYEQKYLKYKNKYLKLKEYNGGGDSTTTTTPKPWYRMFSNTSDINENLKNGSQDRIIIIEQDNTRKNYNLLYNLDTFFIAHFGIKNNDFTDVNNNNNIKKENDNIYYLIFSMNQLNNLPDDIFLPAYKYFIFKESEINNHYWVITNNDKNIYYKYNNYKDSTNIQDEELHKFNMTNTIKNNTVYTFPTTKQLNTNAQNTVNTIINNINLSAIKQIHGRYNKSNERYTNNMGNSVICTYNNIDKVYYAFYYYIKDFDSYNKDKTLKPNKFKKVLVNIMRYVIKSPAPPAPPAPLASATSAASLTLPVSPRL